MRENVSPGGEPPFFSYAFCRIVENTRKDRDHLLGCRSFFLPAPFLKNNMSRKLASSLNKDGKLTCWKLPPGFALNKNPRKGIRTHEERIHGLLTELFFP